MSLAAVATTFVNHFLDQNWEYSLRMFFVFFVDHKRWIVEPVGCNVLGTIAFCCENNKLYIYVIIIRLGQATFFDNTVTLTIRWWEMRENKQEI